MESRRAYQKMASDPGREAPDFLLPIPAAQHASQQRSVAASLQGGHQLRLNLEDSVGSVTQKSRPLEVQKEASVELVGAEEYENEVVQQHKGKSHKPVLSSEESALKAVLAELHLRSSSVSPVSF